MTTKLTPFLMFQGAAQEAIRRYVDLFDDGRVLSMDLYGPDEPGAEGTVRHAEFTIAGQTLRCIDSPAVHAFSFTPATSLFVDCDTEEQLRGLSDALGEGGAMLMPLGDYGFSRLFVWLNDRWGVSWQLNLP